MTSPPLRNPFTAERRLAVLEGVLVLVGVAGISSYFDYSRVDTSLLALPVALGLLTRRESCRRAALAYVVIQAAMFLVFLTLLLPAVLSPGSSHPSSASAGAVKSAFLSFVAAGALLVFGFAILRQADVRSLFRPLQPKHVA